MVSLLDLDYTVFRYINQGMSHPFLDSILWAVRNKLFWIPLYVFLGSFLVINYRKEGWFAILTLLVAVIFADVLAAQFLKPFIGRPRPCYDPLLMEQINLLVGCGGEFGFPSNHATNHFTIASFLVTIISKKHWPFSITLLCWAALVSFAQVYVGKHFPLDVIGGFFLGYILGKSFGNIYLNSFKLKYLI